MTPDTTPDRTPESTPEHAPEHAPGDAHGHETEAATESDSVLFAELRGMWERLDPMPDTLPDQVLFALDLDQLDLDMELLHIVSVAEDDPALAVRSADEMDTITFSGGDITVMVRVSSVHGTRRRLDGWLAPTADLRITVHHSRGRCEATVDGRGRFVAEDIPAGMTRLVLEGSGAGKYVTPTVTL